MLNDVKSNNLNYFMKLSLFNDKLVVSYDSSPEGEPTKDVKAKAKAFAEAELNIQKNNFGQASESLKSIPGRAAPLLASSLVVFGFSAALAKIISDLSLFYPLTIYGLFILATLGATVYNCVLSLADAAPQIHSGNEQEIKATDDLSLHGKSSKEKLRISILSQAIASREHMLLRMTKNVGPEPWGEEADAKIFECRQVIAATYDLISAAKRSTDRLQRARTWLFVNMTTNVMFFILFSLTPTQTKEQKALENAFKVLSQSRNSANASLRVTSQARSAAEASRKAAERAAEAAQWSIFGP